MAEGENLRDGGEKRGTMYRAPTGDGGGSADPR